MKTWEDMNLAEKFDSLNKYIEIWNAGEREDYDLWIMKAIIPALEELKIEIISEFCERPRRAKGEKDMGYRSNDDELESLPKPQINNHSQNYKNINIDNEVISCSDEMKLSNSQQEMVDNHNNRDKSCKVYPADTSDKPQINNNSQQGLRNKARVEKPIATSPNLEEKEKVDSSAIHQGHDDNATQVPVGYFKSKIDNHIEEGCSADLDNSMERKAKTDIGNNSPPSSDKPQNMNSSNKSQEDKNGN